MTARLARACDGSFCTHMLVRGDKIEFVSARQSLASGCTPTSCKIALNDRELESDIKLPPEFVLVHDTTGAVYDPCTVYFVRWRPEYDSIASVDPEVLRDAKKYFGGPPERFGAVEIARGPWRHVMRVQHIRYCRPRRTKCYNHHWNPAVLLEYCERPLAWRLRLPDGCVITDHGFIKP
jgi:hypothetical protein